MRNTMDRIFGWTGMTFLAGWNFGNALQALFAGSVAGFLIGLGGLAICIVTLFMIRARQNRRLDRAVEEILDALGYSPTAPEKRIPDCV